MSKIDTDQVEGIGDFTALTTTNKNTLVDAINEVNGKAGDFVTVNTQQNITSKKRWSTAQTYLRENNIRHIYNVANSVGTIPSITSDNYFLVNLGSSLAAVMWEAEIEIYEYNQAIGINLPKTRVKRFLVTGYHNTAAEISYNRSVTQISGDTDNIESVTFFRDASGKIVLGFKSVGSWVYPKVNLKKLSLHNSQTNTIENAVVANATVTYTNDVSSLTPFLVVPNTNIVKNVDSSNVSVLVPDTNNYLDSIITTNGTTAGTVYTFKRVGLSDLNITLTPASASFSGVVTTGVQTFEGPKEFLKSPIVPNAINSDEAVNKGQLDAVAGSLGNYLEKQALNLAPASAWDTLNENRIIFSGSAANSPYTTYGVGINLYGNANMWGQLFINTLSTGDQNLQFRSHNVAGGWSVVKTVWDNNNFNPAQYVLQSSLNTQLANYATLAGVNTFTNTNTFLESPYIPAGTLDGHAVNLGQLNNILDDYATETWVTQQINNISLTPGPQGPKGDKPAHSWSGTQLRFENPNGTWG